MRALSFHDPAFLRRVAGGGGGGSGGGSTLALADMGAFWRFNEASATDDAVDATGGGATLVASTEISSPAPVSGKIDGARELTENAGFTSGDLPQLHLLSTDSWSIFGWVKVTNTVGLWPNQHLFAQGPLGSPAWKIYQYQGAAIGIYASPAFLTPHFEVSVDCTGWTLFCCGYDAASGKGWISVNNSAKTLRTWGSYAVPSSGSDDVQVGDFNGSSGATAELDNLGWVKATLNAAQIAWLWNGGAGRDITA